MEMQKLVKKVERNFWTVLDKLQFKKNQRHIEMIFVADLIRILLVLLESVSVHEMSILWRKKAANLLVS